MTKKITIFNGCVNFDYLKVFKSRVPSFEITNGNIVDILVDNKVCSSKREAREFISSGAISINGDVIKDETLIVDKSIALEEKLIVIRKGKKNYFIANFK